MYNFILVDEKTLANGFACKVSCVVNVIKSPISSIDCIDVFCQSEEDVNSLLEFIKSYQLF